MVKGTTALMGLLWVLFSTVAGAQEPSVRVIDPQHTRPIYLSEQESVASRFSALSANEKLKLAAEAKRQGVPAIIFNRALENYESLGKADRTERGCFMAADLTSEQPQSWMICAKPKMKITKMPFQVGRGERASCARHLFENQNQGCLKFFGNRPRYCLPTGGRYVTEQIYSARPNQDAFVQLIGLDKDQNDNAVRGVGLQQVSRDGKVNWNARSQSAFALPSARDGISLNDFSEKNRGGLALYVYPAREDIKRFRASGAAEYWNPQCESKIDKPGWFGSQDTDGPSASEIKAANLKLRPSTPTPAAGSQ